MAVTETIFHKEMMISVPNNVLISVDRARADPVLGKVFNDNPKLFGDEDNHQKILAIFLMFERSKGKDSFWYQYLSLLPDVGFFSMWYE
jgi:hypothetical protein